MNNIAFLSGLPRTGSTLLANILNNHPQIKSTPSSPLCNIIQNMKNAWSEDPFLLSQMDNNFDNIYNNKLKKATKSFIQSWLDTDKKLYIDKSRSWLFCSELLQHLYGNFKMIVTIRDLRDIYASVEYQHRKTLLLNFPDKTEQNLVDARASNLFSDQGVIGGPIKAIYNLGDIPNIMENIYIVRMEDITEDPQSNINSLCDWLEVDHLELNEDTIKQSTFESDSYYRFKYLHTIKQKTIEKPKSFIDKQISPRITNEILNRFSWFYKQYYPEIADQIQSETSENNILKHDNDNQLSQEANISKTVEDILKD